jgi:predicted DsbA family dithiol-disulfide isomerase
MLRLEAQDLEDPEMLAALAREAKMEPEEFRAHFASALNGYKKSK